MVETVTIELEPLSDASFEPFGVVLRPGATTGADPIVGPTYRMARAPFEADGRAELYLIRYAPTPPLLTLFERHLTVAETSIALAGTSAFVVADGPPSALSRNGRLGTHVRAFVQDPGTGVVLRRGVWHATAHLSPTGAPVDLAFLSDRETERELVAGEAGRPGARTDFDDLADVGAAVRVAGIPEPRG